jgi:hypothetical protein
MKSFFFERRKKLFSFSFFRKRRKEMPYIYLLHTRASLNIYEPVYKVGRTYSFEKRIGGYDKGSRPLFLLFVQDEFAFERVMLMEMKRKYKQRLDYGVEFFEGDCTEMMLDIVRLFESMKIPMQYNRGFVLADVKEEEEEEEKQILRGAQNSLRQENVFLLKQMMKNVPFLFTSKESWTCIQLCEEAIKYANQNGLQEPDKITFPKDLKMLLGGYYTTKTGKYQFL